MNNVKDLKKVDSKLMLVQVYELETGERIVLGRDLHAALKIKTPYDKWFPRMAEYGGAEGFKEGRDFTTFSLKSTGGRPAQNHAVSLRMARHIVAIQRSDVAFEIREKFFTVAEMAEENGLFSAALLIDDPIERALVWAKKEERLRELEKGLEKGE